MNRILFLFLLDAITFHLFAQKKILFPYFESTDCISFVVDSVYLSKNCTKVFCTFTNGDNDWANISSEMYLEDCNTHSRYSILGSQGLPISPERRELTNGEIVKTVLLFPCIPGNTTDINIIEDKDNESFNVYCIDLKKDNKRLSIEEHINLSDELYSLGFNYYKQGKYEEALAAIINCKKHLIYHKNSKSYNTYCENLLGSILYMTGAESEAKKHSKYYYLPPIDRRLTHRSDSLKAEAMKLQDSGDINGAIQKLTDVLNVQVSEIGGNNYWTANTLSHIASLYEYVDSIIPAYNYNHKALEIRKNILHANHIDIISSLICLAKEKYLLGDSLHGESLINNAMQLVTESSDIIEIVELMQRSAFDIYNYKKNKESITFYNKTITILELIDETDYSKFLRSRTYAQLCLCYASINLYDNSINCGEMALKLRKEFMSKDNYYLNLNKFNLAFSYLKTGNNRDACALYSEILDVAYTSQDENIIGLKKKIENQLLTKLSFFKDLLEIMEETLGQQSKTYIYYLSMLPIKLYNSGRITEAVFYQRKILKIQEKLFGVNDSQYIVSLANYMYLVYSIGNKKEAYELSVELEKLLEKNEISNIEWKTTCYNNLAMVLGNMEHSKALSYLEKAFAIYKENNSIDIYLLSFMSNISLQYLRNNDIYRADSINAEAIKLAEFHNLTENNYYACLIRDKAIINKSKGIEYLKTYSKAANLFRKFGDYHDELSAIDEIIRDYYQVLIEKYTDLHKNQVQHHENGDTDYIPNYSSLSERDSIISYYNRYNETVDLIVTYDFPKLSIDHQRSYRDRVCEFYDIFGPGMAVQFGLEQGAYEAELFELKNKRIFEVCYNGMLLNKGLLLYSETETNTKTNGSTINWNLLKNKLNESDVAIDFFDFNCVYDSLCFAFVTKRNSDYPEMVCLCPIKDLITAVNDKDYTCFYDLVWEKLEKWLKDVDNIYVSTSGIFNKFAIEYAIMPNGEIFSDCFNLHRLSSMKMINNQITMGDIKSALLLGNLDYDFELPVAQDKYSNDIRTPLREGLLKRSGFDPLPNTELEIKEIKDVLEHNNISVTCFEKEYGTESNLKRLNLDSYDIIHFATHGMFVTNEDANMIKEEKNLRFIEADDEGELKDYKHDPLSRSFLVMTGGNKLPKRKEIDNESDDGILTGSEISNLNLVNTKLVVLSACDSGLGDISNEGVLGLQFAIKKAGANAIMMSLDKVDDKATQLLMVEFYNNIAKGLTLNESLKKSQQFLRNYNMGEYSQPKYWGTFILLDAVE
jgi:hypothetical protein